MRRRRFWSLEDLEVRSLLSGMTYSLATNESSYQFGQPVTMTFTETNAGDQPVTVDVSPTDFAVTPAGNAQGTAPAWQSNPENQGAATTSETLQPGQSLTQTAIWDGRLPGMAEPGESDGYASGSYVVTNPNAPQGTTAAIEIASPFQDTLTTDQSTYQLGQTVHFTFTRTNTGDEPAVFTPLTFDPLGFEVTQGGQTIQTSFPETIAGPAVLPIVLQPGQSWSAQGTWDGLEYSMPAGTSGESLPFYSGPGTDQTITGSFAVTYLSDPAVSASFQIQSSPLTYSLTLSQIGELTSVDNDFSYTITNTSDQPVTFNLAPPDFIVTGQYGSNNPVWDSDPGAASQPTTSETLQPGQSLTDTASWAQMNYEGPSVVSNVLYDLSVSVLGAPANLSSTFDYFSVPRGNVTVTGGTTDASGIVIYQPGQPFVLTATETNASDEPVTVMNDADNFDIYQLWDDTTLTIPATGTFSNGQLVTLQPGQSQTFTATWDPGANPNSPAPDGEYQVGFEDAFDNFSGPAVFVGTPILPSATPPVTLPPGSTLPPVTLPSGSTPPAATPPSPASGGPLAVTASACRRPRQPGSPVRITLNLDNVSQEKLHLGRFKRRAEITLLRGSTVVATARKPLSTAHAAMLKPGRLLHLSTDVEIKPSQASLWVLAPGTYTVEVEDGNYSAATTIDIKRP